MKYSLLFLGTPAFAVPILEKIHQAHEIKAVITQPDKAVGRKQILTAPAVKLKALELGLKVLQPSKAAEIPELIASHIDFLITAAYGQYLPQKVLALPLKDSLNVHPSLLPKYRGATPMQSALLNGDDKTGVSIIRMIKKMDAGGIFNQRQFPLPPNMKYPELSEKCSVIGAELLLNVIDNYHSISPLDQDDSQATACHKISKADGEINWSEESAAQIYNKLRAFTPWPGIYTYWQGKKLSLLDLDHRPQTSDYPPGTVYQSENSTLIQCAQGSLELTTVQLAGKKETDIKSFLNGHSDFLNSSLS